MFWPHCFVALSRLAIKADFEALEMATLSFPAMKLYASWLGVATFVTVLEGIGLAFIPSRAVPVPWTELTLSMREKFSLAWLFIGYLAIVMSSFGMAHHVRS